MTPCFKLISPLFPKYNPYPNASLPEWEVNSGLETTIHQDLAIELWLTVQILCGIHWDAQHRAPFKERQAASCRQDWSADGCQLSVLLVVCLGCEELLGPRSRPSWGNPHPVTEWGRDIKVQPSALMGNTHSRTFCRVGWDSAGLVHCFCLFVLFPILLLLPSFYKCWSLINILHLRLHLSVSEVTVVFRSGVRKQAIRWFQSWITYAQLAMNVSSLVEVKHQPPLAQSGSPVIKTFTGGKLGGCTSALGTAYQVFETYRRNSSYNTIRWLFLSAIDTLKKDIIQWRVSDSQLKSRYERSEPLWLHTYKEVLIIHREGQKKMRIKLST